MFKKLLIVIYILIGSFACTQNLQAQGKKEDNEVINLKVKKLKIDYAKNNNILNIDVILVKGGLICNGNGYSLKGGIFDSIKRVSNNILQYILSKSLDGMGHSYISYSDTFYLNDYYIGKYEVTQKNWKTIMGKNPSHHLNCDNCPVEQISWNDIQIFITRLNYITEKNYRLPSEFEWAYASNGGIKSNGFVYSGSNNIDEISWFGYNAKETKPVGQKKPNELGIYDMNGNVWEWCSNILNIDTTFDKRKIDSYRIVLGGSFFELPSFGEWNTYKFCNPSYLFYTIGFRLVCDKN